MSGIPPAPRGVPKIDVTFDLDANGILNVSAKEVSTGNSKNITIKNDKGRLSKREIEKMLADAEQYKEEDDKQRERISSKNQLESYVFNVKQAVEEAGSKLSDGDKKKVLNECESCIKWLDSNQMADKEEFDYKLKDVSKICTPIMTKLHRGDGGGGSNDGPTIEEVD